MIVTLPFFPARDNFRKHPSLYSCVPRLDTGFFLYFIRQKIDSGNKNPTKNQHSKMASFLFSTQKGAPGTKSMGRLMLVKTLSDFQHIEVRFSRIFQKPNKKPDSHEKNALQRYSRYDKLYTRKSTINSEIYGNFTKTILTHREIIHNTKHFSLLFLSLQEIITHNFSSLYSCVLRLDTGFSFVFLPKMLE